MSTHHHAGDAEVPLGPIMEILSLDHNAGEPARVCICPSSATKERVFQERCDEVWGRSRSDCLSERLQSCMLSVQRH